MLPKLDGQQLLLIKHKISKSQKIGLFSIVYVKLLFNLLAIVYTAYMWKVIELEGLEFEDVTNTIMLSGLLLFDTAYNIYIVACYERLLNFLLVPSTLYHGVTWMIPTLSAAVSFSHANMKYVSRPWVDPSYSVLLVALDIFSGVGLEFSVLILLQAFLVRKVRRYLLKQRRVRLQVWFYNQHGQPEKYYDYIDMMTLKVTKSTSRVRKQAFSKYGI